MISGFDYVNMFQLDAFFFLLEGFDEFFFAWPVEQSYSYVSTYYSIQVQLLQGVWNRKKWFFKNFLTLLNEKAFLID